MPVWRDEGTHKGCPYMGWRDEGTHKGCPYVCLDGKRAPTRGALA